MGAYFQGKKITPSLPNFASFLVQKTKTQGYNDLTSTGWYVITDGAPGGTDTTHNYGLLIVFSRSGTSCTQIWLDDGNRMYTRNCNDGNWQAWKEK